MDYRMIEEASVKAETAKERALQLDEGAFGQEMELARVRKLEELGTVEIEEGTIPKLEKTSVEMRRQADNAMKRAKVPEEDMIAKRRRWLTQILTNVETEHARHSTIASELRTDSRDLEKEGKEAALAQAEEHTKANESLEVTHLILTETLDAMPVFNEDGELVHLNRAQRRSRKS